jgi:hypothetical protein
VIVEYGEPLMVPEGSGPDERESLRLELEKRLGDLTIALDEEMGYRGKGVWPHEGD